MVNNKIQSAEENLIRVYNRFPVVLDHGEGMYLYDTDGKEYLDFAAGFAVCGLGYGNKELAGVLKDQIDRLYHTSNLYYHESCGEAAKELNRVCGMDRVFFTNSGGEAIEGALKAARRYSYTKQTGRYEFIAMENSFHGRTFGAVSVTGHKAYRDPFEPVVPGVKFAKFNDLDSVKALVSDKTCAIILEPLQGEGGINPATQEFMEGIRNICDENGILMICDEVQCGMGRTGSMFAWQAAFEICRRSEDARPVPCAGARDLLRIEDAAAHDLAVFIVSRFHRKIAVLVFPDRDADGCAEKDRAVFEILIEKEANVGKRMRADQAVPVRGIEERLFDPGV